MTHTTASSTKISLNLPRVFISKRTGSTNNRLKIYPDNVIYLNDKDNFQLEFENYTSKRYAAEIKINGQLISSAKFILDPGRHIYLDRFIDIDRKFQFDTYEVDDTPEVKSAIKNNGLIEVSFYKEFEPLPQIYISSPIKPWENPHPFYPYWHYIDYTNYSSDIQYDGMMQMSVNNCSCAHDNHNIDYSKCCNEPRGGTIETGRVNKGEKSEQKLTEIYADFDVFPTWTTSYQILPASQYTIKGDIRKFCNECGYRIRKGQWKYCPSCGEAI